MLSLLFLWNCILRHTWAIQEDSNHTIREIKIKCCMGGQLTVKESKKVQHKDLVTCLLDVSLYLATSIFTRSLQHGASSPLVRHRPGGEEKALPLLFAAHSSAITELRHWLPRDSASSSVSIKKRLFFHTQYGPNVLILVSLQSAESWWEPEKDSGRGHATALRQGTFSFMALAGQPKKFILLMARFRVRKKSKFFFFFPAKSENITKILPFFSEFNVVCLWILLGRNSLLFWCNLILPCLWWIPHQSPQQIMLFLLDLQ